MSKKGIFYAIMATLFVSLVVFSITSIAEGNRLRNSMSVIEARVYSLNEFAHDTESDLERELYISGFRALSSLVNYIVKNGVFLDNASSSFKEAFLNGTINGTACSLMAGSSFDDWLPKIQAVAGSQAMELDIQLADVDVYHSSPWHVNVRANASISIIDEKGIANFTQSKIVEAVIDIRGFEDPLYVANSYGRVTNKINQTTYEGSYTTGSGPSFDPSNLEEHAANSLYAENTAAPSYLMRLENNLGPSVYGIESFVNAEEFAEKGLDVKDKTLIDYIYFSASNPASYNVNNMPGWFLIDTNHFEKYQVAGETY